MANDYKQDKAKPPLLDALRPFAPALMALAAMMEDMKVKHQLQGAADPFNEWRQLPNVCTRLGNGLARHLIAQDPWSLNAADALPGTEGHLHATHGLFNLLGAITAHLEGQPAASMRRADKLAERARVELWLQGERTADPGLSIGDQREQPIRGHYWTGDNATWYCTCGAGSPTACTCNRSSGEHC